MKKTFIEQLYSSVTMQIENVCQFNWNNNVDVDKTIYRDYIEYREVKIREVLHAFAVRRGLMK